MRNDRWTNWDQLAVGEDFWDTVEEVGEHRVGEIREQRQMEDIRAAHERRLAKMKFDPEKVRAEPFGFMKNKPNDKSPPAPRHLWTENETAMIGALPDMGA